MIRAIRRQWRYFAAWLRGKQEERADPKVQLEQAIEEAQKQHQALTQQAGAVLANQHQLQIQLGRSIDDVGKLRNSTAQALRLADTARAEGDGARAQQYEDTARAFATNLAATETNMESLKTLHDKALASAGAAKSAVRQSELLLQQKLSEKSKLLTQLEQAKMQESMNAAMSSVSAAAIPGDTPTLDEVRTKIEARYAKALGAAELTSGSVDARMLEVQHSLMEQEGEKRLEEIRRSIGLPPGPSVEVIEPKAITSGTDRAPALDEPKPAETLQARPRTRTAAKPRDRKPAS